MEVDYSELTAREFVKSKALDLKNALVEIKRSRSRDEMNQGMKELNKKYRGFLNSTRLMKKNENVTVKGLYANEMVEEIECGGFVLLVSKKTGKVLTNSRKQVNLVNMTKEGAIEICKVYEKMKDCGVCNAFYRGIEEPVEMKQCKNFILVKHRQCEM
ncbi:hypothetical protein ECANGB1_2171 [Enterospora canceri]|uniref:Uncharacterized protein n=1 Tax=Enterospora canceri TaxID=1081671 RepID=A0A1Y1S509_9MICR|nr:hypothetical protein ECANGB1_2171 [Enterospora canceri]